MRQLKIRQQITSNESESLDKYLQEVSRIELITSDEEAELSRRIKEGDNVALEKLTLANLRFVVSVAKQYQYKGLTLNDLINEGNVGLIKAARRFDETRGFKFISYAVWWIRQSIMQALADQPRLIRLPLNRISLLNKILKKTTEFEQKHERQPTSEELADEMNVSTGAVSDAIKSSGKQLSINTTYTEDGDSSLVDLIEDDASDSPDSMLMADSLQFEINRALSVLNQRESDIISFYFGLNGNNHMTLLEISEKYNLTSERVRQIKEMAIRRLKNSSGSAFLRFYL